jgi:hypothetical protein
MTTLRSPVTEIEGLKVLSLSYLIAATEPTTSTPVELEQMDFDLGGFRCRLSDGVLTAMPDDSFGTVQAARQAFTPTLRAWQVWSLAGYGVAFDASFQSAELSGGGSEGPSPAVSLEIVMGRPRPANPALKSPPPGLRGLRRREAFDATRRWQEVLEGNESTSAGAYGVMTALEYMYKDRPGVADTLQVSMGLLNELGKLISIGDTRSGRKVAKDPSRHRALTNIEERWIEGLIPRLLYRCFVIETGGHIPGEGRLTAKEYPFKRFVMTVDQTAKVSGRWLAAPPTPVQDEQETKPLNS